MAADAALSNEAAKLALFVFLGGFLGVLVKGLLSAVYLPIPYTVFVFFVGIIIGVASIAGGAGHGTGYYVDDSNISSALIVYVFLPSLLFGEVMSLNWHHVKQCYKQSVLLAVPGAFIIACQLAPLAHYVIPYNWSWNYSFLFASVLCATDPVSVVDLLKRTRASSKLTTGIAGESLVNDATAMILYFFFTDSINRDDWTISSFFKFAASKLILSPLLGIGFGILGFRLMKACERPTTLNIDLQIFISFMVAYGSFYVAQDLCEVSGVLSCCTAGLIFAVYIPPKVLNNPRYHEMWALAEWLCNTLIFLLAGIIFGDNCKETVSFINIGYLFLMYVFLIITRFTMVFGLLPLLNILGEPLNVREAAFTAFSGLRGALAIALINKAYTEAADPTTGKQLFFFVAGLCSLTLLIQGSCAEFVIKKLNLVEDANAEPSALKKIVLSRVRTMMRSELQKEIEEMGSELGSYNEKELVRLCRLLNPNFGELLESSDSSSSQEGVGGVKGKIKRSMLDLGAAELDRDLIMYARTTYLQVVRAKYVESILSGKTGSSAYTQKLLLYSIDVALDTVDTGILDWDSIAKGIQPNKYILDLFEILDRVCHAFLYYPGLVGWLDAHTERIAVYTLTSYIEAHEYACSRLPHYLGSFAEYNDNNLVSSEQVDGLEEENVKAESQSLVRQAKKLLDENLNQADVTKLYTHRAANVVMQKQIQMIHQMVKDGELSEQDANSLFTIVGKDNKQLEMERYWHKEDIIRQSVSRRIAEERQSFQEQSQLSFSQRLSLASNKNGASNDTDKGGNPALRNSFRGSLAEADWHTAIRDSVSTKNPVPGSITSSKRPTSPDMRRGSDRSTSSKRPTSSDMRRGSDRSGKTQESSLSSPADHDSEGGGGRQSLQMKSIADIGDNRALTTQLDNVVNPMRSEEKFPAGKDPERNYSK